MNEFPRKAFKTSDGASLSYISEGRGTSIVLIHGWSQSAEQFKYQIPTFADRYHVIAVDLRGHGKSEKVTYGYRISRLSKDLQELIDILQLEKPHLLGHSMGCAVIWSYIDLFGTNEIDRLVSVDQSPLYTSRPYWNSQEIEEGAIVTSEQLNEAIHALLGAAAEEFTRNSLALMVTAAMPKEQFEWMVECNLQCPRSLAATLLYNQFHTDWPIKLSRFAS